VTATGEVLGFGARQSWCPSSPISREHALRLTERVVRHFAGHPALALWHVSNELGCHNARCYCEVSSAAFGAWLRGKYGDLESLNAARGTSFWSQRYTEWAQITAPRSAPTFLNTQVLDFHRFSSEELREQLVAERELLRSITPDVPVTTNFMVMGDSRMMDYSAWASDVDIVSNDHYLTEGDPEPEIELALSADIVRGLAGGSPWMLMEQATSAVNWGQVNRPKRPGELRRNTLANVARGADSIGFFQWRSSTAGAEKYHSAMLPHAGPDTRVHREVRHLGAELARLSSVAGSTVTNDVAILFDWSSWWASEADAHPSTRFGYREVVLDVYRTLWRRQIGVDVIAPWADLSGYRVAVAPALHVVSEATARNLSGFVANGGSLVVTYFSGIVDDNDHVWLGGYLGPLRDVLGVRVEEFHPLREGETRH